MPLFISRRGFFAGLAFSLLLTSFTYASTVNIPQDNPAVSVDIPDSWKPEETDKEVACESPDKVATIFFEVTSSSGLDALIDENVDWLTKRPRGSTRQSLRAEAGIRGW